MIESYKRSFDVAWPASAGPSHLPHLRFEEEGDHVHVRHSGRGLPAPFHRGVSLSFLDGNRDEAPDDVAAIVALVTDTPSMARQVMAVSDRIQMLADRGGMKAGAPMPISVCRRIDGSIFIVCNVAVEALDDAGNAIRTTHALGDHALSTSGWREMAMLSAKQEARRALSNRRLVADPVTAAAFSRMADGAKRRLLDHLRANPKAPPNVAFATAPNWSEATLAGLGLSMPPDMETVYVRNGRIVGRVRLAERTIWNTNTLIHRGETLPQTALAALAGGPVGRLIDHPDVPRDLTIRSIRIDGFGAIRAEVECRLSEVI